MYPWTKAWIKSYSCVSVTFSLGYIWIHIRNHQHEHKRNLELHIETKRTTSILGAKVYEEWLFGPFRPVVRTSSFVGIGNVFSSLIHSVTQYPSLAKQLFGYAILGFALTKAIALFASMMAFLISFVFWSKKEGWTFILYIYIYK